MKLRTALTVLAILTAGWLATTGELERPMRQAPVAAWEEWPAASSESVAVPGQDFTPAFPQANSTGTRHSSVADRISAAPLHRGGLAARSSPKTKASPSTLREWELRRADAARFLAALHRDFTGTEGDAEAIALWADLIAAGTLTREQAVEHFLDSAPQLQGAAPLARLYLAFFERVPDEAGWRHWRELFAAGQSLEGIGELFASSAEFAATYGSLDDGGFVDVAFRNTFGRDPSDPERAQWRSRLSAGLASRGQVMLALSESTAFREAVANEVDASLLYSGLLGRTGDAPGLAAWMRTLEEEAAHALLDDRGLPRFARVPRADHRGRSGEVRLAGAPSGVGAQGRKRLRYSADTMNPLMSASPELPDMRYPFQKSKPPWSGERRSIPTYIIVT